MMRGTGWAGVWGSPLLITSLVFGQVAPSPTIEKHEILFTKYEKNYKLFSYLQKDR